MKKFTGNVYGNRRDSVIQIGNEFFYDEKATALDSLEEYTGKRYYLDHISTRRNRDFGGYVNACVTMRFLKYAGRFGKGYVGITNRSAQCVYVRYYITDKRDG